MSFFARSRHGLFASRSLLAHLLRGAFAAACLYWAVTHESTTPVPALLAGVAALVALRGCPMCWTLGLIETVSQRLKARGRSIPRAP